MLLNNGTTFEKTLALLHRIERQYGSIAYCPINDSNYRKLHRLYPERSATRERTILKTLYHGVARSVKDALMIVDGGLVGYDYD